MLVKFQRPNGTQVWVNPRYVTSIESEFIYTKNHTYQPSEVEVENFGKQVCKIWVVGHAGYSTYSVVVLGTGDEIAKILKIGLHEEAIKAK